MASIPISPSTIKSHELHLPHWMSANNDNTDSVYSVDLSVLSTRKSYFPGMEVTPYQYHFKSQLNTESEESSSMSALTMQTPSQLPYPRNMMWEDSQPVEIPYRPRTSAERIELPSIRLAIPELQLCPSRPDPDCNSDSISYSPTSCPEAPITPASPCAQKRRKLSTGEDHESDYRCYTIPRLAMTPTGPTQRPHSGGISPTTPHRRSSLFSTDESWTSSNMTSPYIPSRLISAMRSPPDFSIAKSDWKRTLPGLPSVATDPDQPDVLRRPSNWSEYSYESPSGGQAYRRLPASARELQFSSHYPPPVTPYGYQQSRNKSLSDLSSHPTALNRTPFFSNSHTDLPAGNVTYGIEIQEMGNEGVQRKRRGNLPKETTDKLRAWFVSHLQHPYPTEEEKQELMRQTDLQMNQISNWFINARRRQLPALISNARAESVARSARSEGASTSQSGSPSTYASRPERGKSGSVGSGESEGEGSSYEDELEKLRLRHRVQGEMGGSKRESF